VANVARRDVEEFLALAARIPIKPEVEVYPFEAANLALYELRTKRVHGAKVLVID
jgi:propanol-preferring alcohol dehydrogenase